MNTALQTASPSSLDAVFHLTDETLFTPEMLTHALDLLAGVAGPLVADVAEESGRREINRVTRAVGGAISRLDERRRGYVAALKARPKAIDDLLRTTFRQPAEALKDKIRAPLTAWEEELRLADEETAQIIEMLNAPILAGSTAAALGQRLDAAQNLELPDWLSETQRGTIVDALQRNIPRLSAAMVAAQHAEFQAAELDRLREVERQAELRQAREEAAATATKVAEARAQAQIQALEQARAEPIVWPAPVDRSWPPITAQQQSTPAPLREDRALIHRAILADLEDFGIPSETAKRLITAIAKGQIFHLAITY